MRPILSNDRMKNGIITTIRQKIYHPAKEKSILDRLPTNVAHTVAMVVERLKRDEMWGKVFVHERANGQLKVMIQEIKKKETTAVAKHKYYGNNALPPSNLV